VISAYEMFKGFYDKMFKNSKDEILIEYKNNVDDNSVLQNASALANTPANIQNAYASASAQQSYAYGYSSASSANTSHAVGTNASQSRTTGYHSNPSNYTPSRVNSYTNAFSAASNSNSINQHLIDSKLEGTLLGIMEVETLQYHIHMMPDGTFASFPFKDVQYEYYMEVPVRFGKKIYYKIKPYVRERIIHNYETKKKDIGFASILPMESIDSVDDIPDAEEFTYAPINTLPFKITNMRQSLNDNTYRFFIYDTEIAELYDDEEEAFVNSDLSMVLQFFNHNNIRVDKFTKEFEKQRKKFVKKFGEDVDGVCEVFKGICTSDWIDSKGYEVLEIKDTENNTTEPFYITFGKNKILFNNKLVPQPSLDNYSNQNIKLLLGVSNDNNTLYYALFVGGNIETFEKFTPIK